MISQFQRIALCILSLAVLGLTLGAQSGVDTSFTANPSTSLPTNTSFHQIVQPDGKVIVYKAPSMFVNGVQRSGMFRLNADGSTDTSFAYNNDASISINNIMLAPDGKIVLAGVEAPNHSKLARLNPNGSVDQSFSVFIAASGPPEIVSTSFSLNAIQPDGKVIATRRNCGNIQGTWCSYSMHRYNVDGSSDLSFAPPALEGGHLVSTNALVELLPDGRFYLAINTGSHLGRSMTLSRRLANGNADPDFGPFTRSISGSWFINFNDLAALPDGGVLAAGVYWPSDLGSLGQPHLLKFLPNGATDSGFTSPNVYAGIRVHPLPDGKVLYSATGGAPSPRPLVRLNANGSIDNTYVLDPVVTSIINSLDIAPMNRPVFLANTAAGPRLVRLLETGAIDPTFTPSLGAASFVSTMAVQADGKIIVTGPFTSMNGVPRNRIARLNADGSIDTTFNPGTGFTGGGGAAGRLVLLPDGKILATGGGLMYNGVTVDLVRINPDGTRDDTFTLSATPVGTVSGLALQPDGKILIGGGFTSINGVARSRIARLNSDGELDLSFNAEIGSSNVSHIIVESTGKITIAGSFSTVNGVVRNNLARLESTGALDTTFNPSAGVVGLVSALVQQPDGKYLLAEDANRVQRRNIDGSVDNLFTPPELIYGGSAGFVNRVLLQPDGTILIGGQFDLVSGIVRRNLTRLRANGAHDPSFMPNGPNAEVLSLVSYPGGKAMVGGFFTSIDNVSRMGVARINIPAVRTTTPFDFDGDGRADISVYRPSTNRWYEALSTGPTIEETFGIAGDILAPADFDGDGKTDEAIFRPSNGHWWYKSSLDGTQVLNPFGGPGDIPRPSDFDGDGKADLVLFRPSNNTWYRYSSLANQEVLPKVFGQAGDQPVVGDFDGDGRSDLAIFRPSNGDWWYAASSANGAFRNVHWGQNGDIPVPADYDGDAKTDYAVYRPSDGGWYIYNSGNGSFTTTAFGTNGDRPVAADYDGDGRADLAVFRPSTGIWYLLRSTSGFAGYQFGISTDVAVPGSLIP